MARKRGAGRRTDYRWILGQASFSALGTGSSAAITVGAASSSFSETLMRVRGNLMAYVDTTQAPGGATRYGLGLIKAQAGQGTTVLSLPLTDGFAPWIWYATFGLAYEEMVTDVVDVPGVTSYRERIDSKAMRKLPPDVELQLVIQSATVLGGGVAANVQVELRMLLGS